MFNEHITMSRAGGWSPLQMSLLTRLGIAAAASAVLWLVVVWAIAGV